MFKKNEKSSKNRFYSKIYDLLIIYFEYFSNSRIYKENDQKN